MAPLKALSPGDPSPDFSLVHRPGEDPVRLSREIGSGPVILFFFPLAFSSVCTEELCALAEAWEGWDEAGVRVLGISVDSPFALARFAQVCDAEFPLLSDFNREACTAFGVRNDDFYGMEGVANRSVFLVDGEGIVRYVWISEDSSRLPDLEEVRTALADLNEGA
jgi:glutaredoxin-dependent peroxiredoxin